MASDHGNLTLSIIELLNIRSPIWTYQFLQTLQRQIVAIIWPCQLLT